MTPYVQAAHLALPVGVRDHILGPASALVTLVEYADFECPYCDAAHMVVKEIYRQLQDQVRLVFRHFPLATVHPHAEHAAEAAEAAAAQGRFWEMHDTLFEQQTALDDRHLMAYAEELGLDTTRFAQEMAAHTYAPRVREDFTSGVLSGVNGTPTFFINGVRHDAGYDLPMLLAALQDAGAR